MSRVKTKKNYHLYHCELITLTPIHIGSGNEYTQLDYFYEKEENRICLIDQVKLMDAIKSYAKDIDQFNSIITDLTTEVLSNIDNTRLNYGLDQFVRDELGIDPSTIVLDYIPCSTLKDHKVNISEFINTGGKRYIPGSSIKGALRTAYLYYQFKKSPYLLDELIDNLHKLPKNKKRADREIQKKVFGPDAKKDLFRAVAISDTEEIVSRKVSKIASFDYLTGPVLSTIFLETTFNPKYPLDFTIKINDQLLASQALNYKEKDSLLEVIRRASNEHSIDKLNFHLKQIKEMEGRTRIDLSQLKDYYERILEIAESISETKDKILLQIGRGSGFFGTTINLLLHETEPFYLMNLRRKYGIGKNRKTHRYDERFPKTHLIDLSMSGKPNNPLGWALIALAES